MFGSDSMKDIKCEFAKVGMACAYCGMDGFVEGTSVRLDDGWRDVAGLIEGDIVFTLENGPQPIRQIVVKDIWRQPGTCPPSVCPIFVPSGGLGNQADVVLQGETMVAIASDAFQKKTGSAYALLQSFDLIGFLGVQWFQPELPAKLFQLHFDHEELVPIAHGAVACCPSILSSLNFDFSDGHESFAATVSGIPKLPHDEARAFLEDLEQELLEKLKVADGRNAAM